MSRWLRPHSGSAPAALGPVRLRVVPPRAPVPTPPQYAGPLCPPRLRAPSAGRCPACGTLAASRDCQFRAKALPLSALGGAPAAARHLRRPALRDRPDSGVAAQCRQTLGLTLCLRDVLRTVMLRGLQRPPPCPCKRRSPPVLCPATPGQSTAGLHRRVTSDKPSDQFFLSTEKKK